MPVAIINDQGRATVGLDMGADCCGDGGGGRAYLNQIALGRVVKAILKLR